MPRLPTENYPAELLGRIFLHVAFTSYRTRLDQIRLWRQPSQHYPRLALLAGSSLLDPLTLAVTTSRYPQLNCPCVFNGTHRFRDHKAVTPGHSKS